ncbi:MAG: hypothetical protein IKP33_01730 [Prevotella sp.]|nr:hypothetical protein [Prevotella sp.]
MSDGNNKMRVPCNSKVKAYNTQHLNNIAAMSVSEVYNSVSASGGIITKKAATCKKRIESLIQNVTEFRPSVPMTHEELQKVDNMLQVWMAQLRRLLSAVSVPVKPTYLRDSVTKILQSKGYTEPCTNRHLEWYLVRYDAKQLIPAEIADAIIQHRGSQWSSIPHLVRDADYNINAADSDKSEGQKTRRKDEDFIRIRGVFEFIESFPATPGIDTLDARLANDITVADMVRSWRKKSLTRYDDYMTVFQTFINSLQTLPDDARQITFADTTEKATDPKKKGKTNTKKSKAKAVKPEKADAKTESTRQPHTEDAPVVSADDNKSAADVVPSPILPEESNEPSSAGDDAQVQSESLEEDPGEEPDFLTPDDDIQGEQITKTDVPGSGSVQTITNNQKLMAFLKEKAIKVPFLAGNIDEPNNANYIKQFGNRQDFDKVFAVLVKISIVSNVTASEIMGYIRNVVLRNETNWPTPAR